MKKKQVIAVSCAIMLGATSAVAGLSVPVQAEESMRMQGGDEIRLADADGITIPENPKNVALGKKTKSSSQETDYLGSDKLVDGSGDTSSRWSSARGLGEQSIEIDLGAEYLLEGVNLFWESGKANSYSILVSSDGTTWESAYRNESHPSSAQDFITFKAPVRGQYVKLHIDSISNKDPLTPPVPDWDTISLYEIQVLETQNVQVDKTNLKEMYDATKGLEAKYNTNSPKIIENYKKAISEAERLLADGAITTQDEIEKATAELENRYYSFVVEEMKYYYSPNQKYFDYNQYTTESVIPLRAAYEAAGNYSPNRPTEELKKNYADFLSAKEKVQLKPENPRGMYIGINPDFDSHSVSQAGEFVFQDYLKVNEDGTKTPMLHIEFKNTGINPVTGQKITNNSYLWKSSDFNDAYIMLDWTPYYPTEEEQGGSDWLNDYIENVSAEGFTADVPMEHGPGMYTVHMTSGQMKRIDSHGIYYSNEYVLQQEMTVDVSYSNVGEAGEVTPTNQDVTVTLTANEPVQDIEGWTRVSDTVLTKAYSQNGTYSVTVVSNDNQQKEVTYTIAGIDKQAPTFQWIVDNSKLEQSKEVRLETSEEIQLPGEGWSLKGQENGTYVYVKTFTANWKDKAFTVTDLAGNVSEPQFVEVKRIDNTKPAVVELTQDITDWTKKDVTVTIKTSVDCATPEGWKKVDKRTFTKVFTASGEYSVTLTSATGVTGDAYVFSITNIDKEAPVIDYAAIEAAKGYKREIPLNEGEEYTEEQLTEMFTKPEWVKDNSGTAAFKVDKWGLEHGLDGYQPFTSKTPGEYKVRFYAYDAAGNSSSFDVYVKVLEPEVPEVEERTTTVNYTVFVDHRIRTGQWTHTGTETGDFTFDLSMVKYLPSNYKLAEGETGYRVLQYGDTTAVTFYLTTK